MSRARFQMDKNLAADSSSEPSTHLLQKDDISTAANGLLPRKSSRQQSDDWRLNYYEIPSWQQENEYILSGYRPTTGSIAECLASLAWLHNETMSTWSHLLGAVLFLLLPFRFFQTFPHVSPTSSDVIVVSIYCLGVAACFALSATCHIVWNHSPRYASTGNKLDYLGIVVLMWSASIPTVYYGFICDAYLRVIYMTIMTGIASACATFTLDDRFASPMFRPYRASLYALLGVSWIGFVVHGILRHGWETQVARMSLQWVALVAFLDVLGACVYAARVPERWREFTFDIVGGSHQIFHVLIVLAALAHLVGVKEAFAEIRANTIC